MDNTTIYTKNVIYPLTKKQLLQIPNVWIFIKGFYDVKTDNKTYFSKNRI